MATGSNIVVADATSPTPVNHTYVWDGQTPDGISLWEDRSVGVPIGYWIIRASLVKPRKRASTVTGQLQATGSYRVRVVVDMPVLETVSNSTVSGIAPAPTISYKNMFDGSYVLSERGSLISREHICKMVPLILQNSQFVNLVTNLDCPR